MTVRELGSHLNLDSGTLTPLLKRLEKQAGSHASVVIKMNAKSTWP